MSITTAFWRRPRCRRSLLCHWSAAALLVFGGIGCQTMTPLPARHGPPPQIVLSYYPYGPALERELAQPHPNYHGWTDERMLRDLDRFEQLPIDLLLLAVDTIQLKMPFFQQRYEQFFALLARENVGFKVALWVYATPTPANDELNTVIDWLVRSVASSAHYARRDGRALLVLAPELSASPIELAHPGIRLWRTAGANAALPWQLRDTAALQNIESLRQAVVCGGYYAAGRWQIERRNGRNIRDQLVAALHLQPQLLGIASWNNFADGSFIEPNSLDNDRAFSELKRLLAELKTAEQKR